MNKINLHLPNYDYNGMTPLDALKEIDSWDFNEIFGSDAERLSDAIKRLKQLVYESAPKVDNKTGLAIINEKLGILASYKYDDKNQIYNEIYFYDKTGKEFYANMCKGYEDNRKEEMEIISNLNSKEELANFFKEYVCYPCFVPKNAINQFANANYIVYEFNDFGIVESK